MNWIRPVVAELGELFILRFSKRRCGAIDSLPRSGFEQAESLLVDFGIDDPRPHADTTPFLAPCLGRQLVEIFGTTAVERWDRGGQPDSIGTGIRVSLYRSAGVEPPFFAIGSTRIVLDLVVFSLVRRFEYGMVQDKAAIGVVIQPDDPVERIDHKQLWESCVRAHRAAVS